MKVDFIKIHAQGNDYLFFDFEALICGSALRSIIFYLHKKFPENVRFDIETLAGIKSGEIIDNEVKINIGTPKILEKNYQLIENYLLRHNINIESMQTIDVGNPHLVIYADNIKDIKLGYIAPQLEKIADPIYGINIEFCKVINPNLISMRVWERGSGITFACGTGASASAYSGIVQGFLQNEVRVDQPGGHVIVQNENEEIFLSGKTEIIFDGTIDAENFI